MLSLSGQRGHEVTFAPVVDEPLGLLAAYDPAAWQALFDANHARLYRFAYARTGDSSAAEEIAAEVFVAAAKGIRRYRQQGSPISAWLFRIARNLTADHLDRRRRAPQLPLDGFEVAGDGWEDAANNAADIAHALSRLTSGQQEVLVLRFFGGCSLEEAAVAMGKRVGAIKVLQHRALAAMRRELTAEARP